MKRSGWVWLCLLFPCLLLWLSGLGLELRAGAADGHSGHDASRGSGLTPAAETAEGSAWREWAEWARVLTLRDYNTRLVVVSTTLLGISCGLIGTFLLLRKRSLMGDTLSHATLPGIGLAFMIMVAGGSAGKSLPGLLLGAALFGVLGFLTVVLIRGTTRIKDDAAMGIVLSVFFGMGVAILGMIQSMPEGSAAGLESFIYGKAASMVFTDFVIIASVTVAAMGFSVLLFKEFRILCFDEDFAAAQGWPVTLLDVLMLLLVTSVTVAGLQAVGLILVIAFLITPAAAARFWTHRLSTMLLIAGLIGGMSGWIGASVSGLFPRMPAGAIIVLMAALLFLISMFLGSARGVIVRLVHQRRLRRKIGRQHLLRAIYEWLEAHGARTADGHVINHNVPIGELVSKRSWTHAMVLREVRAAYNRALVTHFDADVLLLSEAGLKQAERVTRNHRLWELYLIENADIAPSHVDRDADAVEHVLGEKMVTELERMLSEASAGKVLAVPTSPHS